MASINVNEKNKPFFKQWLIDTYGITHPFDVVSDNDWHVIKIRPNSPKRLCIKYPHDKNYGDGHAIPILWGDESGKESNWSYCYFKVPEGLKLIKRFSEFVEANYGSLWRSISISYSGEILHSYGEGFILYRMCKWSDYEVEGHIEYMEISKGSTEWIRFEGN